MQPHTQPHTHCRMLIYWHLNHRMCILSYLGLGVRGLPKSMYGDTCLTLFKYSDIVIDEMSKLPPASQKD